MHDQVLNLLQAAVVLCWSPMRSALVGGSAAGERLMKRLFDPYRPELHYMRGPGPKWRERQARLRSPQTNQMRSA